MAAADFGVSTAVNVCAACITGIFREIKRYVINVIFHEENLKNFEESMKKLKTRRGDVEQTVRVAENNLETIYEAVNQWFQNVDNTIKEEEEKVKDLVDRAKANCFIGLCPSINSRYQLSKKAGEYVAVIDELLKEGQFDKVAFRNVPVASNIAASENYEAFDSRKEVFDQIVKALEDPTISRIGVYGTGGMGKTTLVQKVAKQVEEANLFCPAVLVEVTPTPNIEEIQRHIAEILGLNFVEKNTSTRASLLSKRLEKEQNILIVLDDIWDELNLEEVGISFGDQHKGCKILLTSRNLDVLRNKMGAETFRITDLEEEEALDLFKKMAEIDFEDPELLHVATKVAKRCGGLPLAIVTVAKALKNKGQPEWEDALHQLQMPSPVNDIPAPVYSAIRLSYDKLQPEGLKRTFLLCCLLVLVHSSHIEELLRFAMGLHLFEGVNTVVQTRNRVLRWVNNLKDSCLLLDDYKNDSIGLHDFVRDVAIVIARENHAFVLRDGDVFEEWPDEEKMQNFEMVCLSFASIQELPSELECPQLTLFSMGTSQWDSYLEMPPAFFEKMKKMEVLNLIQADFLSSASSISFPTSLRTLCLERCRLGDIVSLGKLKNLEILSLSESNIERLPEETGQLTKLRSLDLTACTELKIIPPGVLSSLSRLEELFMGGVIVGWNQEGNARLYELKELSRLTTLEICILDAEIVKENFLFEKLQRYKIVIGDRWGRYEKFENPRTIKLRVNTSIDHVDDGLKGLLKKTEALYLEDLKGVEIVLNQVSNGDWFLHLSHLEIKNALEIQYIMNANDAVGKIVFRQLRSLRLWNLPSLVSFCFKNRSGESTSVCQDELPLFGEEMELPFLEDLNLSHINAVGRIWHNQFLTLKSLATLSIYHCGNLKDILSSSTAKSLAQLKRFYISGCNCLREIIFSEDIEEDDKVAISFPQLRTLSLLFLPHFIGFCSDNYKIIFSSLKRLRISHCPELKEFIYKSTIDSEQALFDEKVAFPQLENLTLEKLKKCRKIWHDQLIADSFSRLNDLSICYCKRLLNVFSFNMSEKLQNLTVFEVKSCNLLEEIFEPQILDANGLHAATATPSIAEETATSFVFSKLTFLHFSGLPKLKSFYYKMHTTKWPSLKKMKLWGCDMVEIVFASESLSFGELTNQQPLFWVNEDTFPNLEELSLKRIPRMTWRGQFRANVFSKLRVLELKCFSQTSTDLLPSSESFENLTTLKISRCHGIVNLTACFTAKILVQLTEMSISGCEMIEEIIAGEGDEVKGDIVFARLKHLKLSYLPSLASFCIGKHNFDFPALEKVSVIGCPKMKIFSQGDLSTPMLQRVQFVENGDKGCWEGNLNATIQWLFAEKIGFREIEKLSLFDSSKWIEIWRNHERILCFKGLTILTVHDCNTLRCLFTVSIALDLPQLQGLQVKNCIGMEHIILDEGLDEEVENKIVFPRLEGIFLECCADLTSFYQGSKILKCQSLEILTVIDCPKMFAFASTFSRETIDDGGNTSSRLSSDAFFDNKVEFPQLYQLMIDRLGNCRKIWHNHLIDDSFSNLTDLRVWNCDKLLNVFSLNMSHRLRNLMTFKVGKCDSLEEIFEPQVLKPELHTLTATESIVFASLEYLHLSYLPSLDSFCSEKHNFEFPDLGKMIVRKCPKMKIFCEGDLSAPELQKVILTENEEVWRWEGNLKATIQRLFEEMNVQNAEEEDEEKDDEDEDEDEDM